MHAASHCTISFILADHDPGRTILRAIGKVVGGTKGNKILEYVSGAPNKPVIVEEPPNPLDYDELTKYGYGKLVTPIMNAGGRNAMYQLLDLEAPVVKRKRTVVTAPPLVIDRTGANDPAAYQGLRLGQVLDDAQQAEALQRVQQKIANGERPAASQMLEQVQAFERPFSDKRNVGPKQTPDWTVERLDEWGRQQGRVQAWARAAREGAFVRDPAESTDSLTSPQRVFSVATVLLATLAFGRATPGLVSMLVETDQARGGGLEGVRSALQVPAAALVLASLGSSAVCALTAPTKNRSRYVWTVKGFLGGPLTVRELASLPTLITQQEQDEQNERESAGEQQQQKQQL